MKDLMVSVSGVRGVVGEGLTPEVVLKYASAFGEYLQMRNADCGMRNENPRNPEQMRNADSGLRNENPPNSPFQAPKVVVGRDSRTSGEMVEYIVSSGLMAMGCDVVQIGVVPTPTVQVMVEELGAQGGIAITASHNPREWNALKLISRKGTFLSAKDWEAFQPLIESPERRYASWENIGKSRRDATALDKHLSRIFRTSYIDKRRVARKDFRVAVDCVHGAGGNAVPRLLEELGCQMISLGCEPDGLFPRNPEPVAENLSDLCQLMKDTRCEVGFACDPDADRLAIVDENGTAIGEEYTLALSAQFVLSKKKGPVVTNLSTSRMLDDVAVQAGVAIIRTPVGEAHVVEGMARENALIGGEGNGGVILPEVHLGRDALVGISLILQAMAETGKKVSQMAAGLPKYHMVKQKVEGRMSPDLSSQLKGRFKGCETDERDGLKLSWEDAWVQVRGSGTEPVIRVIAEARDEARAEALVEDVKKLLLNIKMR